ncbi:hypothetical protein CTI12_AA264640 [Artemisia annua]|uniref:Uncharacterized protein n=1 Tax=Artemisia annua TaxID=35608 RepID=A0A2U1NHU9_ARTAN|nr:hypothetical protein CTI12_AA264640 [Artemisia annua]
MEKKETTFVGVESRVFIPETTFVGVESKVLIPKTTFVGVESRVLIPETTVWDTLIQLVEFNPDKFDVSVLWTWCSSGNGAMRVVNNTSLNLQACTREDGGVEDGTTVALWGWTAEANQMWATTPFL